MNHNKIFYPYIPLGFIIAGFTVLYCYRLTYAPLWFDEAVEYWYSKIAIGKVPGYDYTSMYERIVSSFQPPLYNWLMYIWLHFFDSEAGFRFAGVLITMIGSIGLYKTTETICNSTWALISVLFYLGIKQTGFYALECAEYNLMLACLCWTLFFFFRSIKSFNNKSIIGFFICACLSVYSQYGAVIPIVIMYMILVLDLLVRKQYSCIKKLAIPSLTTLVIAAFPLLFFYLIPQMENQGSLHIEHTPYFRYGNLSVDFVRSFIKNFRWLFTPDGENFSFSLMAIPALISFILTWIGNKRKRLFIISISLFLGVWTLYYFLTAFNFYGVRCYDETRGTWNIGLRYSLFLIPCTVPILTYIFFTSSIFIKEKFSKYVYYSYTLFIVCFFALFSFWGATEIYKNWHKEDLKEVVEEWYKINDFDTPTLVHLWSTPPFSFYLSHHENYIQGITDANIIYETKRTFSKKEMYEYLSNIGLLTNNEFYYIISNNNDSKEKKGLSAFLEAISQAKYHIKYLYIKDAFILKAYK